MTFNVFLMEKIIKNTSRCTLPSSINSLREKYHLTSSLHSRAPPRRLSASSVYKTPQKPRGNLQVKSLRTQQRPVYTTYTVRRKPRFFTSNASCTRRDHEIFAAPPGCILKNSRDWKMTAASAGKKDAWKGVYVCVLAWRRKRSTKLYGMGEGEGVSCVCVYWETNKLLGRAIFSLN